MFDSSCERQFALVSAARVVALHRAERSLEARQRDIYDSHRHRVFALAYYMTGNELEAEGILTATFTKAFGAAQEPDGRDVDCALLEQLRKKSYLPPAASEAPAGFVADFDDSGPQLASRNVKRTELEEAVSDLPATERLLFLLRDVEGYTPADIAQFLDMTGQEVQRGLFAARLRLRRSLAQAQAGDEERAA